MFNKNELVLDKVRSMTAHDLKTHELLLRLTSLEEPTLTCTAEGEEVTDAIGAVVTTLYRAKKATFGATNSFVSLDLAAAQYGAEKEVATDANKIVDYDFETLAIGEDGTVKMKRPIIKDSLTHIYSLESGEIATGYEVGAVASATEFMLGEDLQTITVPTGLTGKIFVEYQYETTEAVRIVNKTSEFPKSCMLIIYAFFRDRCNDNLVYEGKIICPKAKLNPESVELNLTSTGKHAFEYTMMKDYCNDEDVLFTIIVSDDDDEDEE